MIHLIRYSLQGSRNPSDLVAGSMLGQCAGDDEAKIAAIHQSPTIIVTAAKIVLPPRLFEQGIVTARLIIQIPYHDHNITFRNPYLNCVQLLIGNPRLHYIGNLHWCIVNYNCDAP